MKSCLVTCCHRLSSGVSLRQLSISSPVTWIKYKSFPWNYPINVVEIWVAVDIISKAETSSAEDVHVLINPANRSLTGTQLPYFPVGGPVPLLEQTFTNQWGGMDVGSELKYTIQAVDGRVHMESGVELRQQLRDIHSNDYSFGGVVITAATESFRVKTNYDFIFHAAVPLSKDTTSPLQEKKKELVSCYINSFTMVNTLQSRPKSNIIVTSPLLGTGTAGFSVEEGSTALKEAISAYKAGHNGVAGTFSFRLVVQQQSIAEYVSTVFSNS